MSQHLSYLMGAENIQDKELEDLGIQFERTGSGKARLLKILESQLSGYISLMKGKLTPGFWNEIIGEDGIRFFFKFTDGSIKEYTVSSETEPEIATLCTEFNHEPPGKTANVYRYLSENEFYHDFMLEHYSNFISRP